MKKSPEYYLKQPYSRVLIPVENAFFAEILEFPGCYAEGKNPTEAFKNLERSARAWIKAALENNQNIPEPAKNQGYSGKVVLRLPRSLHRKAAQFAENDRTSLNQFFASAIAAQVGAEEFGHRLIEKCTRSIVNVVTTYSLSVTNTIHLPQTSYKIPGQKPMVIEQAPEVSHA